MAAAAGGQQERLAALVAHPSFADGLALALELQNERPPALYKQVTVCRVLIQALPALLPPAAAVQLISLARTWLSVAPTVAQGGEAVAATQLQAEAAHLYLALLGGPSGVKLPAAGCWQLLQQVCSLFRQPPWECASMAAGELTCTCLDLLAQLPQWYLQVSRPELAAAVAAVAAVLDRQTVGALSSTSGGGWSSGSIGGSGTVLPETPATTRLLCKLLKALQVLLAEAKKDHGANAASLAAALQRLFTYGWQQQRGGQARGSSSSSSGGSSAGQGSGPGAALLVPSPLSSVPVSPSGSTLSWRRSSAGDAGAAAASRADLPGASPGKYRPPRARTSSSGSAREETGGSRSNGAGAGNGGSSEAAPHLLLELSDSESSDAEGGGGGGERYRSSRVRCGALACLQLLAKADPKSLHGSWTALLRTADLIGHRHSGMGASVADLLLSDPQLRVRHAAAATIATLLEGPAQRAYLGVAEARELERQPIRGFVTLSASLGHLLVALHQALLHTARHDHDPLVLAATLRALGTLLLGAPYHRLPPQLLPMCVSVLLGCLARVTPAAGPGSLSAEQLPVASACLSCLAAAFSSKATTAALAEQLLPGSRSGRSTASENSRGDSGDSWGTAGSGQQLLQLLFAYAACQQPAVQLEAVMALRGVAQQHATLLQGYWERLLAIGRAGTALQAAQVVMAQPPRAQIGGSDGSLPEKVAQQSIRLPGDFLGAAEEAEGDTNGSLAAMPQHSCAAADDARPAQMVAEQWQQLGDQVLQVAVQHTSPLLRAAAQAVIAALSPPAYAALPVQLRQQLLGWCCAAPAADEASPVRAAAAKAVGALAACPALCTVPDGPTQVLAALAAGCHDGVLAVRIAAAASLATFCHMLSQAAAAAQPHAAGSSSLEQPGGSPQRAATIVRACTIRECLRLAVAAAADSDKLRPSSMLALGSLFCLQDVLPAVAQPAAAVTAADELLWVAGVQAVRLGLAAGNARVQWAACGAAGQLLACRAAVVQQHGGTVLQELVLVLQECPNFRSRALAATALQQLGGTAGQVHGRDRLMQVLDAVATVLFQGKRCGFSVAAPSCVPSVARSSHHDQPPQQERPEPAELGARAQLEAALVGATLHLLALLPAAAGTGAGSGAPSEGAAAGLTRQLQLARETDHLECLRRLVQQAGQELQASQGEPEDAVLEAAEDPALAELGRSLFNVSHVASSLVAAAARGLALLGAPEP